MSATSAALLNSDWVKVMKNEKSGFSAVFIGIDYNKPTNTEEVYKVINAIIRQGLAPAVLMESYNCMCEEDIASGQVIPYKRTVPSNGTKKAVQRLKDPAFRARLSGEVLAVLFALGLNLDVIFCDRSCVLSVDRMINRCSVDELEQMAAEGIRKVVHESVSANIPAIMAQNAMLTVFPELFSERHKVMAYFARKRTETSNAVIVIGGQHIEHVVSKWDRPIDIDNLLTIPPPKEGTTHEEQLRKRGLMMALFATTSAFPVEAVTVSIVDLNDEDTEKVKGHFKDYRKIFQQAMVATSMNQTDIQKVLQQRSEAQGLPQLTELLTYFENN